MTKDDDHPVGLQEWIEYFEGKLRDAEVALANTADDGIRSVLHQRIEDTRLKLFVLHIDIYAWAAANAVRLAPYEG